MRKTTYLHSPPPLNTALGQEEGRLAYLNRQWYNDTFQDYKRLTITNEQLLNIQESFLFPTSAPKLFVLTEDFGVFPSLSLQVNFRTISQITERLGKPKLFPKKCSKNILSLCLNNHHTTKSRVWMKVQLRSSLTSALVRGEWLWNNYHKTQIQLHVFLSKTVSWNEE